MAVIETWLDQDLKKPVRIQYLAGNLFSQDNMGNLIGVNVTDDGAPATLGGSVSANVIRADGATVTVDSGVLSGNKASVTLPQAAYAVPGVITVVIKITDETDVTTLAAVVTTVYRSSTDTIVDPGTIIPSIQTLISQIETAVASIPADYSSLWTTLAPAYSTSATYAAGQYVTYNGGLYRCTTAITSAESWTAAHWTAAKIGPDLSDLKSAIVPENLVPVSPTWNVGDGVQSIVLSNALPAGKYKLFINATSNKSSETSVRLYLSKTDTFPSTSSGNRILSTSVVKNNDTWIDVDVNSQIKSLWLQVASSSSASAGYTVTVNKEPVMYNKIVFTDTSLSIPDIPADAKTVGDQIDPIQVVYPSNANDWTTDASNITARLSKYGYCKLAPGTYRISTIGMPNGATKPMVLEGSGKNTIVIVENGSGYGIRISNNCAVRNLVLRNENTSYTPADIYTASTIKHGIKVAKTTGSDKCHAVIENVSIENFSGAGILVDATGQGTSDGNHILNCFVDNCGAGLWLNQYAEFNRVECCNFDSCYYGVICDGGNNTICNCGMSRNIYGFYMNNGSGNLQNNSHSQVVGCIFNHEDYDAETGGKGWAIWINGAESGFQFVGGQIFYGGIYVKNSVATCINDFNIGKMIESGSDVGIKIQLDHDDSYTRLVVLNNCIFAKVPRIIKPENDPKLVLYLNNCYTRGGTPITP